jgi:hypothetical protein
MMVPESALYKKVWATDKWSTVWMVFARVSSLSSSLLSDSEGGQGDNRGWNMVKERLERVGDNYARNSYRSPLKHITFPAQTNTTHP